MTMEVAPPQGGSASEPPREEPRDAMPVAEEGDVPWMGGGTEEEDFDARSSAFAVGGGDNDDNDDNENANDIGAAVVVTTAGIEADEAAGRLRDRPNFGPRRFSHFVGRIGRLRCCRFLDAWPRTSALLLGVCAPLLLLVAMSVFFGHFLARLEGPHEIATNNDVLATRMAMLFQDDVVTNITNRLPQICSCTYLMAEEQRELDEEYEACLRDAERDRTAAEPSSRPSSSTVPSGMPSLSARPVIAPSGVPSATNAPSGSRTPTISPVPSVPPTRTSPPSDPSAPSDQPSSYRSAGPSSAPYVSLAPSVSGAPDSRPSSVPSSGNLVNWTYGAVASFDDGPESPPASNDTENPWTGGCVPPQNLESVAIETIIQGIFNRMIERCTGDGTLRTEQPPTCGSREGQLQFPRKVTIDPAEMLASTASCGRRALSLLQEYRLSEVVVAELVSSSASFNWIRCSGRDNNLARELYMSFNPYQDFSVLGVIAQEENATEAWRMSQQILYCQYMEEAMAANVTYVNAKRSAFRRSIADADGFDECVPNKWAGSWYWFTVMTTIGYGNTAPQTNGGRAMVFTFGFFSILLFAGILAKAGSIVVAIVDDWLDRIKLSWLTQPAVQALLWGALYYLWCLMIAAYFVYWNMERLDATVDFADGYWYAYITTTTVGLGDYYLEHAAVVGTDLIVWPLLILFGFVLLSSFLNKMGELFASFVSAEQSTFAEALAEDERPMFSCCPTWFQRRGSAEGEEPEASDKDKLPAPPDAAVAHEPTPIDQQEQPTRTSQRR